MEIKEALDKQVSKAQDVYQTFKYLDNECQELFIVLSLDSKNKITNAH